MFTLKPLKLATAVTAFFLAFSTLAAPVSSLFSVQTQADTLSAINSPEAYLTVNGKTNSNGTVEGYASYGYLTSKLPISTDYAVSGLSIAVNGIIKGETLNLACDLETPKVISEVTDYCSDNFYNQLLALENLNNNKGLDKAKQIKPVLKNTDSNKLQESKKDVKKKNLLEKLLSNNSSSNSVKISSLSLQGSIKILETIKTQISKDFNKATVEIQYTTTQELKIQQKLIEDKINDKVTKEKKSKEQATVEVLDQYLKQFSANQQNGNLGNISKKTVEKVESIKTIDENTGNVVLSQDKLNKLKLAKVEENSVKQAITEFNKLSIAQKSNLNNVLNEEGKNITSGVNNKTALVSGLVGGVKAEAGWCSSYVPLYWYWWGVDAHITQCNIDTFNWVGGGYATIMGALAATPCGWFCGTLAIIMGLELGYINWLNSRCGGNGVMLHYVYRGPVYWFWTVC